MTARCERRTDHILIHTTTKTEQDESAKPTALDVGRKWQQHHIAVSTHATKILKILETVRVKCFSIHEATCFKESGQREQKKNEKIRQVQPKFLECITPSCHTGMLSSDGQQKKSRQEGPATVTIGTLERHQKA